MIVNSVWYRYYRNTQSVMHTYSPTRVEYYKKLYDAFSHFCEENACTALLPIRTFYLMVEMLWSCIDIVDPKELIRIEHEFYHHGNVSAVLRTIENIDNQLPFGVTALYNFGVDYYLVKICMVLLKRRLCIL